MSAFRILVTGSRDWQDEAAIENALDAAICASTVTHNGQVTVVSGACPTGADFMAEKVAAEADCIVERHPADWTLGRSAGFRRNAEMVALGADVCLAFISECTSPRCRSGNPGPHPSHGATHTADLAEKAGIPTRRFTPNDGAAS